VRHAQHKCHTKKIYPNFDFKNSEIILLEECSQEQRYKTEQKWIDFFKSCNKSKAGVGPKGFMPNAKEIKRRRKQMIEWRKRNPEKVLLAKVKSITPENQKIRSRISHQKRWERMKAWVAICKKSGKVFGPFKGYFFAKKVLNLHQTTLIRGLLHKTKNRRFEFKVLE
jgi:hypothetical protein